nr:DNA-deoxyinosine glycosylase [Croceicoccus marinus]
MSQDAAALRKTGFAPVVNADTRLLICGSLPGDRSLAEARYYAHPQNRFWHLLGGAADIPDLPALPYDERLAALLSRGIGLWDVAASGRREGSLDTALRDVERTDLRGLAGILPDLRAVAFNGSAAARIGRRAMAGAGGIALVDLPSSSPAYCAITPAEKQQRWMVLARHLDQGRER